jgi:uncharacterized membrane protein YgdD (TMEM256/DUF423 family)
MPPHNPLKELHEAQQRQRQQAPKVSLGERIEQKKMGLRAWWSENLPRLGFIARIVVYGVILLILYIKWPENKWDRPIGTLSIDNTITPIIFVVAVIFFIRALFSPADDDSIREAWGWVGVVLIVGAVLFAGFIYNSRILVSVLVIAPALALSGFLIWIVGKHLWLAWLAYRKPNHKTD